MPALLPYGNSKKIDNRVFYVVKMTVTNECIDQLAERLNAVFERLADDEVRYRTWKANIEDVNKAAMLLSESVVKNRNRIVDKTKFCQMLRAYLNIMFIPEYGEKRKMEETLCDLGWLDNDTIGDIIRLSKPGRYLSVQRTLPKITNSLYEHRTEFLDLIEVFAAGRPYVELWKKVGIFVNEAPPGNPATFTGILTALQPLRFMVYNKRSVAPLYDTECSHLAELKMGRYLDFNNLYRKTAKRIGKDLVDLDIASVEFNSVGIPETDRGAVGSVL